MLRVSLCLLSHILLFDLIFAQQQRYVSVTTNQGTVQGTKLDYGNNRNSTYYGSANCFLGVPYAQPPTGDRRFQTPEPIQAMNGVYDATYLRGRCPQPGSNPGPVSEDCLYLNIFTQNVGNTTTLSAVMVFIGGSDGLNKGGADGAEIPGTIRNLVTRGVVVVTLQYRLGALGFMDAPSAGIPANLGMHDQVLALQWVQANIQSFGGDPSRITLAGQQDGACAVAAHSLSPMSQGLFHQAILQSGSIYSCFDYSAPPAVVSTTTMPTLNYDPGAQTYPMNPNNNYNAGYEQYPTGYTTPSSQYSSNQAQNYGNPQSNNNPSMDIAMSYCNVTANQFASGKTNNLMKCLQSLTVDIFISKQGTRESRWVIVRDNSFFPGTPESLANSAQRIPMIIGTVQDEDADYIFKMVADGDAQGQNTNQLFNGWFVDYAKRNKLSGQSANDVRNIISSNYNLSSSSTPYPNQNNMGQQYDSGPSQFGNPSQNNNQYNNPSQNNQYNNPSQNNNQYDNPSQSNNQYNNPPQFSTQSPQYNKPSSVSQYNGSPSNQMTQSFQLISQIASDASGVSESVTQASLVQQTGSEVRLFQFTYVTEIGRNTVPKTGSWKPVFKGQDMYFLTMSETVWKNANPTSQDYQVADQMGTSWTDFAKTGQVANWKPATNGNYNYCNMNTQPIMSNNYGAQARKVFNDQVNPIVDQVNGRPNPLSNSNSNNNNNNRANVMVHNQAGQSSWSISFSIPNFPNIPIS